MIKTKKINDNIDWIQVTDCTDADQKRLLSDYHLNGEMLYYVLDHHERPRFEYYDDEDTLLFIYDVAEPTRFSGDISAEPIGMIIRGHSFFTFTHDQTNFVNDLIETKLNDANREKLDALQPIDLALKTFYQLAIQYFDYINQINSRRTRIQRNLRGKARKSSINSLLSLQTDLVYFLTSLSSDNDMLLNFKRRFTKWLSEDQQDSVEDALVEIQQGLSMAKMANEATQQVASAYSNLLDSQLNGTMKFLTVFALVLSVPNIIFGFFGENVKIPFTDSSFAWEGTILISIGFIGVVIFILWMNDFFKR